MILSNIEIHAALDSGKLVIDPEPHPRFPTVGEDHCPYNTCSVDLMLGPELSVPHGGQFSIDFTTPGTIAETIARNSKSFITTIEQPFKLTPNSFILGRTHERISLPLQQKRNTSLAARIEGRSSRARLGLLVHFTAPTVHPGFEGNLTLEMINLGPSPILLVPYMSIAQLIIEEVKGCPVKNESQFQGQSNPAGLKPTSDMPPGTQRKSKPAR